MDYKQASFLTKILKCPVFNNIGRFILRRFKNIFVIDVCYV